jgi:hypothetical protein
MKRLWTAAILLLAAAAPAFAHAMLEHAVPGAGALLSASPASVSLTFSQPLEPAFSGIEVSDAAGHDVTGSAPRADGMIMQVALKKLAPGAYRVSWHAVSIDTHRTEGAYNFRVKP